MAETVLPPYGCFPKCCCFSICWAAAAYLVFWGFFVCFFPLLVTSPWFGKQCLKLPFSFSFFPMSSQCCPCFDSQIVCKYVAFYMAMRLFNIVCLKFVLYLCISLTLYSFYLHVDSLERRNNI